ERILEWMKLCLERRLDAFARLVSGPQVVAEGFDDVIRRDADMRCTLFDHLKHGVQHTDDRTEWRIHTLVEGADAIEVAKQLVGAVDEMNDHGAREGRCDASNVMLIARVQAIRATR